jgi:DNA gyrase/topoisomerase IV subunit B
MKISGLNGLDDRQENYGILPFKGKIPKVQGKSIESIIKNVEIQTLIKTL